MPQSWAATLNGLQRSAFDAKDSLLVIDELTGARAVETATEFVQCQGNLKARDRMTQDRRVAPVSTPADRCSRPERRTPSVSRPSGAC